MTKKMLLIGLLFTLIFTLNGCYGDDPQPKEKATEVTNSSFSESKETITESEPIVEIEPEQKETLTQEETEYSKVIAEMDTITVSATMETPKSNDTEKENKSETTEKPIESTKPKENTPSKSESKVEKEPEPEAKPEPPKETEVQEPETPKETFDVDYWIAYAKQYATSIGLELDVTAVDCWDTGFVLDETVFEIIISKDKEVVEVEIINEYVRGNITLTKVDEEYPDNKLTGAEFEVYKDINENGEIDEADEFMGNLEEVEIGIYEMHDLFYGKYLVCEVKAPEGFLLDEGVYAVFIETDETTYSVENKAGVGFINAAMRGNLKIVKTSSDGKVEGFAFRVTGENGYDMTFETDKNGEIFIEGLRIGNYTVSEVANQASAVYIMPADKNATIKLDSTTIVEMHNEYRDTPKTGEDSNLALWFALAGISVLGIAVTSVVAYKKHKKEGDE